MRLYIDMTNAQQKIDNQRDVNTRTGVLNIDAKNKIKSQIKNVKNNKSSGEDGREKGGKELSFLFVYMYNKYMFYVVVFSPFLLILKHEISES